MLNRSLPAAFLAALLVAIVPACTSQQPMATTQPAPAGSTLLVPAAQAVALGQSVQWASGVKVPAGGKLQEAAVLGDMLVLLENPSNIVSTFRLSDGKLLWQQVVGQDTDHLLSVGRVKDRLLVSSERTVYTLDADTGKLVNMSDMRTSVQTAPAMHEGDAIFGGITGRVFAHSLEGGYARWSYQMAARILASPTVRGVNVAVVDANGTVAVLDTDSGKMIWRTKMFAAAVASPVITKNHVLVPSLDNTLYAFDVSSGRDAWKFYATEALSLPVVADDSRVYLPLPTSKALVAIDLETGKEQWRTPMTVQQILPLNGSVLVANQAKLTTLDATTGKTLQEVELTHPIRQVLPGPDGGMIVVGKNGQVVMLAPR